MQPDALTRELLEAALDYADRGWAVMPLHWIADRGGCSCAVTDCRSPGKHPLTEHGVNDATTDEAIVRSWWRRWPVANVGIATGRRSGLLVLDVDPRNGGDETFAALVSQLSALPDTQTVATGGGGGHSFFVVPEGELLSSLGPGIDIKGSGGYVVAPPSAHVSGGTYVWRAECSPDEVALATLPDAWFAALRRPEHATADDEPMPDCEIPLEVREYRARAYVAKMPPAISGQRGHDALWNVALVVVRGFMVETEPAMAILRDYSARCMPPWSERELQHKIEDARQRCQLPWGYILQAQREASAGVPPPGASDDRGDKTAPTIADILAALAALTKGASVADVEPHLRGVEGTLAGMRKLDLTFVRARLLEQLKRLGVPDAGKLVDAALGSDAAEVQAQATGQGKPLTWEEPEPWDVPVEGTALLDELVDVLRRYVVLPAHVACAIALWCLHTYAIAAADVTPRLALTSPTRRCGKTKTLTVIGALVHRALRAAHISPAVMFRVIEANAPTLLIDEADTFLANSDELRGIVNAGHERGGMVLRSVGDDHEPRGFVVFGPVAVAAIGNVPATIADRAIEIRMSRKTRGERVERFRHTRVRSELEPLRRRMARWAADHLETVRDANPEIPARLNDRQADGWLPLLAIADLAGGDWPERARKAAVALAGGDTDTDDARTLLLADLRALFRDHGAMRSETIVDRLVAMDDRPWPEWSRGKPLTAPGLAKLLQPYGVRPTQVWIEGRNQRGYTRATLEPVWKRYLRPDAEDEPVDDDSPESPSQGARPLAPLGEKGFCERQTARDQSDLAGRESQKRVGENDSSGLAGRTAGTRAGTSFPWAADDL